MPPMSRYVDERTWLHLDHLIFETQPSVTLQQQYELMLWLIVPKPIGRYVAVGDDPLDAEVGPAQDRLHQFLG